MASRELVLKSLTVGFVSGLGFWSANTIGRYLPTYVVLSVFAYTLVIPFLTFYVARERMHALRFVEFIRAWLYPYLHPDIVLPSHVVAAFIHTAEGVHAEFMAGLLTPKSHHVIRKYAIAAAHVRPPRHA